MDCFAALAMTVSIASFGDGVGWYLHESARLAIIRVSYSRKRANEGAVALIGVKALGRGPIPGARVRRAINGLACARAGFGSGAYVGDE